MDKKLLELEQERRDRLLNAALKEFVLKGYDHSSTNVIAKEAKMSKALMFHYVNNKQDLFLAVYDYFTDLLEQEYFEKLDFSEGDIFVRLHWSYLLQLQLIKRYPWILDFDKLSAKTKSAEINQRLATVEKQKTCQQQLFDNLDKSKFRNDLDHEKCKQFILWINLGFISQIVEKIKSSNSIDFDEAAVIDTLDEYLKELKKLVYAAADE
ncbi:TetR/AcrR family transcriptional regulator [Candidatus Enterococcus ferrettii]|uniref:HTH tetR-type domain-containing protein n=1 Tax=Candidatus Enterococcus ferrettii TaxID=2815324 RepID=A0ABV0EUI1_9ENTE|nr:TetR/AcrR family transcriptional regulator [Enterococcus sp. 665A]MBO1339507.1 TetR/AcrR family transcriptional regulator [Enterococcus sp. 665A]